MARVIIINLCDNKQQTQTKEFSKDLGHEEKIKLWLYELFVEKDVIGKYIVTCITAALNCLHYTDYIQFGNDKTSKRENVCFTISVKDRA